MRNLVKISILKRYQSTVAAVSVNNLNSADALLESELASAKKYEEIPRLSKIKTIKGYLPGGMQLGHFLIKIYNKISKNCYREIL